MMRANPPVDLTPDLWIIKLLLGAIDRSYDSKDEKTNPAPGGYGAPPQQGYGQQPGGYPPQGQQQYGAPPPASSVLLRVGRLAVTPVSSSTAPLRDTLAALAVEL